jgi:large subunit ribosomal protein L32
LSWLFFDFLLLLEKILSFDYDFSMVVRMRHTRSHTQKRRSHHGLKRIVFSLCSKCGEEKLPHTVCQNCGTYNGKEVIDVLKKLAKRERKKKRKELAEQEKEQAKTRELSMEELSKNK